jgi:hypothetical protein
VELREVSVSSPRGPWSRRKSACGARPRRRREGVHGGARWLLHRHTRLREIKSWAEKVAGYFAVLRTACYAPHHPCPKSHAGVIEGDDDRRKNLEFPF